MSEFFAFLLGIFTNEVGELAPWIAKHLVKWAAKHRKDSARYEMEWLAEMDVVPGKFVKMFFAASIAASQIPQKILNSFPKDHYHFIFYFTLKLYAHFINIILVFLGLLSTKLVLGSNTNLIWAAFALFVYFIFLKLIDSSKAISRFIFTYPMGWFLGIAEALQEQDLFDLKAFRDEYLNSK